MVCCPVAHVTRARRTLILDNASVYCRTKNGKNGDECSMLGGKWTSITGRLSLIDARYEVNWITSIDGLNRMPWYTVRGSRVSVVGCAASAGLVIIKRSSKIATVSVGWAGTADEKKLKNFIKTALL